MKKTRPGYFDGCIKHSIEVVAYKVPSQGGKSLKGAKKNGKLRAAVLLSIEMLNAPDDLVDGL
jgi:hypothetical protein